MSLSKESSRFTPGRSHQIDSAAVELVLGGKLTSDSIHSPIRWMETVQPSAEIRLGESRTIGAGEVLQPWVGR